MNSVAIIGLGLIGGSIARDLAARGVRVYAEDRDEDALARAVGEGIVERSDGRFNTEIVVLAVPVRQCAMVLRDVAERAPGARLFIDVGSTKAPIVKAASSMPIAERFVGCHPLAGDHRSGFYASRYGMFEEARVFACPTPTTTAESISRATDFWEELGATVETIDASRHDESMAAASHLPQIASSSLTNALRELGLDSSALGRGGRDMTRLAGSSPGMWTNISLENAAAIGTALRAYREALGQFAAALESRDEAALKAFFTSARDWTL